MVVILATITRGPLYYWIKLDCRCVDNCVCFIPCLCWKYTDYHIGPNSTYVLGSFCLYACCYFFNLIGTLNFRKYVHFSFLNFTEKVLNMGDYRLFFNDCKEILISYLWKYYFFSSLSFFVCHLWYRLHLLDIIIHLEA